MINFSTSQSKEELYSLAQEHNVAVDESMKKTEIINAIQAYNSDLSESDTQEPEGENLSESDTQEPEGENLSDSDTQEPEEENLSESDTQEPEDENLSESDTQEPEDENLSQSDKPKPKPPKEEGDCRTFVYVGPSLPGGTLLSNSTFIGTRKEVENHLAKVIAEYPTVKKLIVPYNKVATMSKRTKSRGNSTYNDCNTVASAISEKRKKQRKQGGE